MNEMANKESERGIEMTALRGVDENVVSSEKGKRQILTGQSLSGIRDTLQENGQVGIIFQEEIGRQREGRRSY